MNLYCSPILSKPLIFPYISNRQNWENVEFSGMKTLQLRLWSKSVYSVRQNWFWVSAAAMYSPSKLSVLYNPSRFHFLNQQNDHYSSLPGPWSEVNISCCCPNHHPVCTKISSYLNKSNYSANVQFWEMHCGLSRQHHFFAHSWVAVEGRSPESLQGLAVSKKV